MQIFEQGESRIVPMLLRENGTTANLTTDIEQIIAILSVKPQNGTEVEVKRYALNPESGHGSLVIPVSPAGTVNIQVEDSHSKTFPVGMLNCCTTVKVTDATFASGYRVDKYTSQVGRVTAGCGLDALP